METSKLLELTKDLEEIEKTLNKSEGAKEQQMETLKKMGLNSVDDAVDETKRLDDLIKGLKEDNQDDEETIEEEIKKWEE